MQKNPPRRAKSFKMKAGNIENFVAVGMWNTWVNKCYVVTLSEACKAVEEECAGTLGCAPIGGGCPTVDRSGKAL